MSPQRSAVDTISGGEQDYALDKACLRTRFQRAAQSYDSAARVQRELRTRLLEHLEPVLLKPERVLDMGAGTGELAIALCRRYRRARVLSLDLSDDLLRVARGKRWRPWSRRSFVCADAERLPLAPGRVDLIVSNASLHFFQPPDQVFAELLRLLKPGGLFMFSTFGPDTLCELRQSFARVDRLPHVHAFADMHDVGDALVRAGFIDVVMDTAMLRAEYADVMALMRELKSTGESNALRNRSRGLTGRGKIRRLAEAYEAHRRDGMLPATFEAVFAHAWKPETATGHGVSVAPPRL